MENRIKPLPIGHRRLVLVCTCGRRILRPERIALDLLQPCHQCCSRLRRWVWRRVTVFDYLRAWWELRRWMESLRRAA